MDSRVDWNIRFLHHSADIVRPYQSSRNILESPEMARYLQVSMQCYKISWNVGSLIDILLSCNESFFCCESESLSVRIREMLIRDLELAPDAARVVIASGITFA